MRRCPKCNRTYTTDTQKFCTHDGGILEGVDMGHETVRLDSAQLNDDESTKVLSDEPDEVTAGFDPFKTVISQPANTLVDEFDPFKTVMSRPQTVAETPRDTHGIASPPPSSQPTFQPTSVPVPPPVQPPPPAPPQVSVPLPPPQPTQKLVGTGPIAASVPLPQPPPPLAQSPQPPSPAVAGKKKSKLPLILGILVLLLFLGGGVLAALYWFVARPMLAKRVVAVDTPRPPTQAPTPNIEATPNEVPKTEKNVAPEPPPYSAPADAVEFVNSKETLDGKLAEHYVDFSFYYPNSWQKDPTTGVPGARNFAQVERRLPPDFTQEQFAVAWNSSAAPVSENRALFHTLAESLFKQFQSKFPGYRKVSEGETKVGVYDGYEFRFEGMSKDTAKGDLKLWGRVIFLPPQDGGKDGVTLLMLATSLASELRSVDDVGVKGELPMMLESFRFGKK